MTTLLSVFSRCLIIALTCIMPTFVKTMQKEVSPLNHNEIAKLFYTKKITDKEVNSFASKLLQERIDGWKEKLEQAGNDAVQQSKIPLYIRLWPEVTAHDLLTTCSIMEPKEKENRNIKIGNTKNSLNDPATVSISLYHNKYPILCLNVLNHELTHVEQGGNGRVLNKLLTTTIKAIDNDSAQLIYQKYLENTNNRLKYVKNKFLNEYDAEDGAFKSCHNPYMLHKIYEKKYKKNQKLITNLKDFLRAILREKKN